MDKRVVSQTGVAHGKVLYRTDSFTSGSTLFSEGMRAFDSLFFFIKLFLYLRFYRCAFAPRCGDTSLSTVRHGSKGSQSNL
nr:MAG TPA_asm: hypothetical protein [Caudoviricetes sp.]